jgi:hypothetical protein
MTSPMLNDRSAQPPQNKYVCASPGALTASDDHRRVLRLENDEVADLYNDNLNSRRYSSMIQMHMLMLETINEQLS